MDSKLVVNHVLKKNKIAESLQPLYLIVVQLLNKFENFYIMHVTRDYNEIAGKLATEGLNMNAMINNGEQDN